MTSTARRAPRSTATLAVLALAGAALFALFAGLGVWQWERRTWKLALIERVEQRLHAAPVALPPPAAWPQVNAAAHEYLPVRLQGRWLGDKTVFTQATTALGAGWWVLTPLALDGGGQVLVNRGFLPESLRAGWHAQDPVAQGGASAPVQVTGLLRMNEPGGGFLRRNAPQQGRWHSRDVQAIAQAQGMADAAPFFVDAGIPPAIPAGPESPGAGGPWPRPGMTVVHFRNAHLVYVFTWWGLAAMVLGAAVLVARYERSLRAGARTGGAP